jgi:ATP-dependent helicase/DNAse subunit B
VVGNARTTLKTDLSARSNLAKNDSLAESLIDWRKCIEQLAKDFLAGRAEVNPREYPKTCERCGLQTLCRIQESQALLEDEEEPENSEGESDE